MNSSSATVTAEVGPGIDPTLLDDALSRARAFCATNPLGALTIAARKTGHPAMPDAVLADVHASVRGRHVDARAVAPTFDAALDHALARLTEQLDRHVALAAV
ncbi:hypothetical protein [Amycolatopsis sp. MtRt-6]|uniref:hypothetical protein n=1 Tax=Amycolatopsis sp. MtRt-6 TaxID=2792782 RepID=UPI001A8C1CA8|nr:hypothetical protein [Amycolatopsis sp. MtRt-6]